ncbi:hypothetical protein Q7P35_011979 [Cladosporium inversicolor]
MVGWISSCTTGIAAGQDASQCLSSETLQAILLLPLTPFGVICGYRFWILPKSQALVPKTWRNDVVRVFQSCPAMATIEMQSTKGFTDTTSSPMADERVRVDVTGMATGTDADALDMARMERSQELRRNFKSLSVFGLVITTMSTWVGLLLGNVFSLTLRSGFMVSQALRFVFAHMMQTMM